MLQLRPVRAVDDLVQVLGELADAGPQFLELGVPVWPLARSACWRSVSAAVTEDSILAMANRAPSVTARATAAAAARSSSLARARTAACRSATAAAASDVGAAGDGPQPFLDGAHLQPGFHLRGPGLRRGLREPFPAPVGVAVVPAASVVLAVGLADRVQRFLLGQPGLQLLRAGQALLLGPLGDRDRLGQPPGLVPGHPGGPGQRAELSG